jgi:hypothetical protein
MSAIPNDRRTRQLYIDAAIKRAQAKARAARLQAAADAEQAGVEVDTILTVPEPRVGR